LSNIEDIDFQINEDFDRADTDFLYKKLNSSANHLSDISTLIYPDIVKFVKNE